MQERGMNIISSSFRRLYPAVIDTGVFSCISRCKGDFRILAVNEQKAFFSTASSGNEQQEVSNTQEEAQTDEQYFVPNNEIAINPRFVNRNPRNKEFLGMGRRKGWRLHYPPDDHFFRLHFEKHNTHLRSWVTHRSGKTLVTAHTSEWSIQKNLFAEDECTVNSAANLARILAHRCQQAGIYSMKMDVPRRERKKDVYKAFYDTIQEEGISFEEPPYDLVQEEYIAGIDYDKTDVNEIGRKPATVQWNVPKAYNKP